MATARSYTPTALPPRRARALAFVAILLGGFCGGLIGWSVTDLQCGGGERTIVLGPPRATTTTTTVAPSADASGTSDDCTTWEAAGALIGATVGAGGVATVSVLVLRAMAEWRRTLDVEPDAPPPVEPLL